MARPKRSRMRVRYSSTTIILVGDSGKEYPIKPLRATGRIFACEYEDVELEFEIGEVGFGYVTNKNKKVWLPEELFALLSAYALLTIQTVFRGYKKDKRKKLGKKIPEFPGQLGLL